MSPIIIIMYIYHALINALSAHMIHMNLNMIFYTHVEHSPTKTIDIKYPIWEAPLDYQNENFSLQKQFLHQSSPDYVTSTLNHHTMIF